MKPFKNKNTFLLTSKQSKARALIGLIPTEKNNRNTKQAKFTHGIDYPIKWRGSRSIRIKALQKYVLEISKLKILQIMIYKANLRSINKAQKRKFIEQKYA